MKTFFPLMLLVCAGFVAQAQQLDIEADRFLFVQRGGESARKWIGGVVFKQKGTTLSCDSSIQFPERKLMKCYGNVRMVNEEGTTMTSRFMEYNETTRMLYASGNVVVQDDQATLYSEALTYDLAQKAGWYTSGGRLVNDGNTLTSGYGKYYKSQGMAYFSRDVKLVGENFTLTSDTLKYNLNTKMAYFYRGTKIVSKDGTIYAEDGTYNTATEKANLLGRSQVATEEYYITGDILNYDKNSGDGESVGNVYMKSRKDSVIIEGDRALYYQQQGRAELYKRILIKQYEGKDTLYITADTLFAIDSTDTLNKEKKILAWGGVQVFRPDLQALCDSLVYNYSDSSITLHGDPVLWTDQNQLTGDTIFLFLDSNALDSMYIAKNAFLISEDSLGNYNQVKGREMSATFRNKKIKYAYVNGNGQTIFNILEGDTAFMALNTIDCAEMVMTFTDSSKLSKVNFIGEPDARFIPPKEILEPERYLKGFSWQMDKKPSLATVMAVRDRTPPRLPYDDRPGFIGPPRDENTELPEVGKGKEVEK